MEPAYKVVVYDFTSDIMVIRSIHNTSMKYIAKRRDGIYYYLDDWLQPVLLGEQEGCNMRYEVCCYYFSEDILMPFPLSHEAIELRKIKSDKALYYLDSWL